MAKATREELLRQMQHGQLFRLGAASINEMSDALGSGADALALLRTLEWSGHEDAYAGPWEESCPCCHRWKSEAPHERSCELARLIGAVTA